MIKYSVLIPNYGYSLYIFECLDSVINQKKDGSFDLEIIMYDQSEISVFERINNEILSRYGVGTINLIHTNEKGVLKARHKLIQLAKGEYIQFVDSDDLLEEDYFIRITNFIISNNSPDIVMNKNKKIDGKNNVLDLSQPYKEIEKQNFLDYVIFDDKFNSIWRKTFKKELYSKCDYKVFDVIYGDDKCLSIPIVQKSKYIAFSNIDGYLYRMNLKSLTHNYSLQSAYDSLFLLDKLGYDFDILTNLQATIYLNNFLLHFFSLVRILNLVEGESIISFYKKVRERALCIRRSYKTKLTFKNFIKYQLLKFKVYKLIDYLRKNR